MKQPYTFEFYRDRAKEWRWRLRASNGRIVADSGEGYKRRIAVKNAVWRFRVSVLNAEEKIEELTPKKARK